MKQILTIGRYFRARFGTRVRKIPISLQGFTCPNIDGTKAKGGCIYCKNESFSPSLQTLKEITQDSPKNTIFMNFSLVENPLLDSQIETLKAQFFKHANYHKDKYKITKYIIYFQSFSNTYAPFATLERLYSEALNLPNVVGLSIGTRVDCIEDSVLEFLSHHAQNGKDIWVEYGIQSTFNQTLRLINRAHDTHGAKELIQKTRALGIKVCVHLIFGLPKESEEMMMQSLKEVLSWGIDGIKIHPLYIVKETPLEQMFKAGKYTPISLESYTNLIVQSLKLIPENVVIQRVSAGVHDDSLIAPKWCFDKNIQMNFIREKLLENGIRY
ncbi:TIGR01212 family radical SAM protein [Helicobacter sp. 23-1044]